jgi:hypothetical protein
MGVDAAVAIVRECMPVDDVLLAAAEAFPSGELAVLISDESALPKDAARNLGAITAASLWAPVEAEGVFQAFVLALSRRAKSGACGLTVVDHACASAFILADRGALTDAGSTEGDDYLSLPVAALERAFSISLGLTTAESLVLTDYLLSPSSGFRLLDGDCTGQLTEEEAIALLEADEPFAEFDCVLGL